MDHWSDATVYLNGKPIGTCTGISFSLSDKNKYKFWSIDMLKNELKTQEECENYEECAIIRDLINNMCDGKASNKNILF